MFRPEDITVYNDDIKAWTAETRDQVISEIDSLGIIHRENSKSPVPAKEAIKTSQKKSSGVTNRISFRMPRHMVFVSKGVGRGVKISDVGSSKRTPKPWFNPVIEKRFPELLDIVADHQGAMVLNAVLIK